MGQCLLLSWKPEPDWEFPSAGWNQGESYPLSWLDRAYRWFVQLFCARPPFIIFLKGTENLWGPLCALTFCEQEVESHYYEKWPQGCRCTPGQTVGWANTFMFKGQGRSGLSWGRISFLSQGAAPSDCFTRWETLCLLWQGLLLATRGLHRFIPSSVGQQWESCLLENYSSLKTSPRASPARGVASQGPHGGDYSLNNQAFLPDSLHDSLPLSLCLSIKAKI